MEMIMKPARRAPRVAIAAAILAGIALTAGMLTAGNSAAFILPCSRDYLRVTMKHIPGSAGAGQTEYELRVENVTFSGCQISTHPGLELLEADGKPLPTHVTKSGPSGLITIYGHRTLAARLKLSPDIAGPGEPTSGRCEPEAHHVRVSLPRGEVTAPVEPPTSVCEHGHINEETLKPG